MNFLYFLIPIWAVGTFATFAFLTYSYWKSRTGEVIFELRPIAPRREPFLVLLFALMALVWPFVLIGTRIYRSKGGGD